MYKIHSLIVTCLLIATATFGQVRFGVQGSGQLANWGHNPPPDVPLSISFTNFLKPRLGFRAGIMADIPLKGRLSIRPQLLYSVKGPTIDWGFLSNQTGIDLTNFNSRLNYNYLELPVQVMYGLSVGPGRVVVGAGPYVAYLLSASETTIRNGHTVQADLTNEKRIDYGLNASVDYELPLGVTVSAYYSFGLANLESNSSTNQASKPTLIGSTEAFHRVYGLSIGYFLKSAK